MVSVCILDYGSGNVKSVFNLIEYLGYNVKISNNHDDIENSSHIVLPGVGSFGASMKKINENIPIDFFKEQILEIKKPFLGICVGMQVLADTGFEFGKYEGLGIIGGTISKLKTKKMPLPHIGWNEIIIQNESQLLNGLDDFNDFYFVHSYAFEALDKRHSIAVTEYDVQFTSVVQKENIYGVQFHPEKSQKTGQLLFKNFFSIS